MIQICENRVILTGEHAFRRAHVFMRAVLRFEACGDGWFSGIAGGRAVKAASFGDCTELVCRAGDFEGFWRTISTLTHRDYGQIAAAVGMMSSSWDVGVWPQDKNPAPAAWEALCSFIISQCNNIPRIKRIISTFYCPVRRENGVWAFVSGAGGGAGKSQRTSLRPCAGYRAAYLVSAANAVVSGKLTLTG